MNLAAAILLLSAQPEPRVTLDLPIMPLTDVVKGISEQAQTPIKVIGHDAYRRMFVQVKNMPFSRLRQALATATGGRWSQGGTAWQLQLPPVQDGEQAIFAARMEAYLQYHKLVAVQDKAHFDSLIQKALEVHRKPDTWETSKEMNRLESGSPAGQCILSLLKLLPATELTSVGLGERRVYSTSPTRLQRPLPPQAARCLEQLKVSHTLMTERVAALAPEARDQAFNGRGFLHGYSYPRSLDTAERFLLVLSRTPSIPESLGAEIRLFDRSGRQVSNGFLNMDARSLPEVPQPEPAQKSPFAALAQPLVLSEDEKEFADDLAENLWKNGDQEPKLKAITRRRLLQMDKEEPLVFGPTQVLREAAKALGKQLVVRVDDRAMIFPMAGVSPKQTLTLGIAASACIGPMRRRPLEYEESPDLIVIKPCFSREGKGSFTLDRRLLAAYLRAHDEKRDLLDPLAELCSTVPQASDLTLVHWLSDLFGSSLNIGSDDDRRSSFTALQIYGRLAPDQKRAAAAGGFASLSAALSPESRKSLTYLIKSAAEIRALDQRMVDALKSGQLPAEALNQIEDRAQGFSFELETEPTIILAAQNTESPTVVFRVSERQQLFGVAQYEWGLHPSPTDVRSAVSLIDRARRTSGTGQALFSTGPLKELRVSIVFSDKVRLPCTFELQDSSRMSKAVPCTQLPEPFRTQIAEELKRNKVQVP